MAKWQGLDPITLTLESGKLSYDHITRCRYNRDQLDELLKDNKDYCAGVYLSFSEADYWLNLDFEVSQVPSLPAYLKSCEHNIIFARTGLVSFAPVFKSLETTLWSSRVGSYMPMKKVILATTVSVLLVGLLASAFSFRASGMRSSEITVPDEYPTIQEAINNAKDWDTVYVRSGVYYETVVVNKTVSLVGEDSDTTIVDGSETGNVVTIFENSVNVTGFTVQNSGDSLGDAGIYLDSANLCSILGNHITNNFAGIWLEESSANFIVENNITANVDDGIVFNYSHNNTISENHIALHEYFGIVMNWSHNNTISRNSVTQTIGPSHGDGINLWRSGRNYIYQNHVVANNRYGIRVEGWSSNNILSDNRIENCSVGIEALEYSDYNVMSRNYIANNSACGIYLRRVRYNNVSGNNITKNELCGISVEGNSQFNSILKNCIAENDCGVKVWYSSDNKFYNNNFINNTVQTNVTTDYANVWDDGYPHGGNYWSDYSGTDYYGGIMQSLAGSDGIGDEPYIIDDNSTDRYPLMEPWIPRVLQIDLNDDGTVNILDVSIVAIAFGSTPEDPNWNTIADLNKDDVVNILDISTVAVEFGKTV